MPGRGLSEAAAVGTRREELPCKGDRIMSSLTKTMIAMSAVAVVITVTLSMRARSETMRHAQLTPAQAAQISPARPEPAVKSRPVNDARDLPPPPQDDEADLEDGNGS